MTIDRQLKEATAVIRQGDKDAGKEMLLNILHDDPKNDMAWVWMSAVVDTDELRLECLEEALQLNPDNWMAQKGIAKLRKNGVGKTAVFSPTTSTSANVSPQTKATVEYLCKRLMIEKWYQVWVSTMIAGYYEENPLNPFIDPGHFLFPVPASDLPELEPLALYFDVILFRQTGGTFTVVCMKVRNNRREDQFISQDELVKIGRDCLAYSPVVAYGQQSPVGFEIWELYERAYTQDDAARLQALKRIPGRQKVSVISTAIDLVAREVNHAYLPGMVAVFRPTYKNFISRWLQEEYSYSEEETLQAVMSGGIKLLPVFLGVFVGIAITMLIQFWLLMIGWQSGWIVDAVGAFTAILIAIYARTVRIQNTKQGIIAAALYGIIYYGLMLVLFGFWLGIVWIWNIGWMIALGALLGKVTDP